MRDAANIRNNSAIKYDADFRLGERIPEAGPIDIGDEGDEYEGNADRIVLGLSSRMDIR